MIFSKNKKGDLINNVLETIVAVAGIIILLTAVGYFGYKFLNLSSSQASENAKKTIDTLQEKLNALHEGENTTALVQKIEGSWYLVSWSKDEQNSPDKCHFDACLCICPRTTAQSCNSKDGFCRILPIKTISSESKVITYETQVRGTIGGFESAGEKQVTTSTNYINLGVEKNKPALIEITLEKNKESYKLTSFTDSQQTK
ncbi:MAG: hypothetical protein Q7S74_01740 [Nanoarchaeota archaeon]|nr:hypothetical protein [Nanoarchaeota archaeon]